MRASVVPFTVMLALFGTTSVVRAECDKQRPAPMAKKLVAGYEPVKMIFTVNRADAVKKAETIADTTFRFWIAGHVNVRFEGNYVREVHHCMFNMPREAKKPFTYVLVWYRILPADNDMQHGESLMLLPKDIVARRPATGITLFSGVELAGDWGKATEKGATFSTLTIKPVE